MRRGYAVLAVPIVAGGLALVWWAPWESSPSPVDGGRAAFGNLPIVHVVARTEISANAPATRPVLNETEVEVWYDGARGRAHVVERRADKVTVDVVGPLPAEGELAPVNPLVVFVTSYRTRLAGGRFRVAGADRIQDRRVVWLRSPGLQVAIDPVSYQALWVRRSPARSSADPLIQIVRAETLPASAGDFETRAKKKPRHL